MIKSLSFKPVLVLCLSVCIGITAVASELFADISQGKRTKLELYVTAKEAYALWQQDSSTVKIIDCRTPEEYAFIGHAPMAFNIPSAFMTHRFDVINRHYAMRLNADFIKLVTGRFNPDQTVLILCRSGQRSAWAVNQLAQIGWRRVYNVTDGFEGDVLDKPGDPEHGRRVVNGWKNSGLPWTFALNPDLVYKSE